MYIGAPPRFTPNNLPFLATILQPNVFTTAANLTFQTDSLHTLDFQVFVTRASRRSLAALAVSRSSGSVSFRHRVNSPSKDFNPKFPIAYAPQDLSQGSSLVTS